ncbi:MAG: cytochrome b/b6 domain-containing protein [Immundisolibacteraceae bacterium]|nr:cytochrome b/b6 domain-containing protein [Immundisolibacteraceae bacterium]
MSESSEQDLATKSQKQPLLVWDLAVRLFHWLLVLLIVAAWVTAEQGPAWMDRHMQVGYAVMTLILFRLVWGFCGSEYARFSSFLAGPRRMLGYLKGLLGGQSELVIGHNPLGGWSVVAMLLMLLFQASTGLFANDDIYNEGPLTGWVSNATSGWLTGLHKLNFNLLLAIISLHIVAVLSYWVFKRDNLIKPMFTGRKWFTSAELSQHQTQNKAGRSLWWALLIVLISAGLVFWLSIQAPPFG